MEEENNEEDNWVSELDRLLSLLWEFNLSLVDDESVIDLREESILRARSAADCEERPSLAPFNLKPFVSLTTELKERRLAMMVLQNTSEL